MLNSIPFIGWFLSFFFSVSYAIPFWFIWTVCDVGKKYFYWLPELYLSIPFWECVGLFIIIGILKDTLVPKLVEVTQKVGKE